MTKKDFVALANVLIDTNPDGLDVRTCTGLDGAFVVWNAMLKEIIRMCTADNPRFNVDKFYTYIKQVFKKRGYGSFMNVR
jgi:hypothetical protein